MRKKRRSGGILREGGTVWEMAATSLDNDALLNSEECHEYADHCAYAYDDSLMGSSEGGGSGGMATQFSF